VSKRVRTRILVAAMLSAGVFAAQAQTPPPAQPQALDHLEERLVWIEKHTDDVVAGRRELIAGLKKLVAGKKVPESDVRQACEVSGDQTKIIELLRGQLTELGKSENQAAMNSAQRKRFAKYQAITQKLELKVDCSPY
jgi:hypothetical protein